MNRQVYFYPHSYLRDRQLDIIRSWPAGLVLNPEVAQGRVGDQVGRNKAISPKKKRSWKQTIPLVNLKLKPARLASDAVVYVWGGLIASGLFIVDLDNPYSLTGYNLRAISFWKLLIRCILLSNRCLQIRCMSEACRQNARVVFGDEVYSKAKVCYPSIGISPQRIDRSGREECRFLFISTQFDIKGGNALVNAFRRLISKMRNVHLDMITYVTDDMKKELQQVSNITLHEPGMTREELMRTVYSASDVLVHPTYAESFGLVVLEAVASGLPIIATDVYAINEMVHDGINGFLITPPLSVWDNVTPSKYFHDIPNIKKHIKNLDTSLFERELEKKMECLASNPSLRATMSESSTDLFNEHLKVKSVVNI